jgi:hypothetical protein
MSKRKPNWTDREKVVWLEEYEKRKVILKPKLSSSITSGGKNRAVSVINYLFVFGSDDVKKPQFLR